MFQLGFCKLADHLHYHRNTHLFFVATHEAAPDLKGKFLVKKKQGGVSTSSASVVWCSFRQQNLACNMSRCSCLQHVLSMNLQGAHGKSAVLWERLIRNPLVDVWPSWRHFPTAVIRSGSLEVHTCFWKALTVLHYFLLLFCTLVLLGSSLSLVTCTSAGILGSLLLHWTLPSCIGLCLPVLDSVLLYSTHTLT